MKINAAFELNEVCILKSTIGLSQRGNGGNGSFLVDGKKVGRGRVGRKKHWQSVSLRRLIKG